MSWIVEIRDLSVPLPTRLGRDVGYGVARHQGNAIICRSIQRINMKYHDNLIKHDPLFCRLSVTLFRVTAWLMS